MRRQNEINGIQAKTSSLYGLIMLFERLVVTRMHDSKHVVIGVYTTLSYLLLTISGQCAPADNKAVLTDAG